MSICIKCGQVTAVETEAFIRHTEKDVTKRIQGVLRSCPKCGLSLDEQEVSEINHRRFLYGADEMDANKADEEADEEETDEAADETANNFEGVQMSIFDIL